MPDMQELTVIEAETLADAFPARCRSPALRGGTDVMRRLHPAYRTPHFTVHVDGQVVSIPARLYFASEQTNLPEDDEAWLFARTLQTRSCDGFERQRAVRDLLAHLQPWGAPFVADLIGQYVIEILDEILAAMTPDMARMIAVFAAENPAYWAEIKQRAVSYWNAYYRHPSSENRGRAYRRAQYVGFLLIDRIERGEPGLSSA